jgi:hypothetical protein
MLISNIDPFILESLLKIGLVIGTSLILFVFLRITANPAKLKKIPFLPIGEEE